MMSRAQMDTPAGGCRGHGQDATIGFAQGGGDFAELREVEGAMFDSLTIARRLTEVGLNREQAECVMADAIRQAAEHGDHVTPDALRAELATLRADIYHAMLVPDGRDHCWNGCSGVTDDRYLQRSVLGAARLRFPLAAGEVDMRVTQARAGESPLARHFRRADRGGQRVHDGRAWRDDTRGRLPRNGQSRRVPDLFPFRSGRVGARRGAVVTGAAATEAIRPLQGLPR